MRAFSARRWTASSPRAATFRVKWTGIQLDRLAMQRSEETLPRVAHNAIDPKVYGILFATNPRQPSGYVIIRGLELSPADIIVYGVGSVGHNRSPAVFQWGSMALLHEDLAAGRRSPHRSRVDRTILHASYPTP